MDLPRAPTADAHCCSLRPGGVVVGCAGGGCELTRPGMMNDELMLRACGQVRCGRSGFMWRGSHGKGLRDARCMQVMCEIGRFAGWWMDVLELERGLCGENGCRGTGAREPDKMPGVL